MGECSTLQLGNSLAMLVEACLKSQEWDGECMSTQHQIALFRRTNEEMGPYTRREWSGRSDDILSGGTGLFSGDVEALYPSLEKETCARAAGRTVGRNWTKIKGVNLHHALIGLASFNTREIRKHMEESGILHLMPERRHSRGKRPGEFTDELTRLADNRKHSEVEDLGESWTLPTASKWRLKHEVFTLDQEKAIIEVYVAHVTRTIMSCHMYKIGGEVRLQRQGGPAGLRVTGTLARNMMGEWRNQIMDQYNKWEIPPLLLSRYVDDCSNVQRLLRLGAVWDRGSKQIKICPIAREKDIEEGTTEEQVTARI